MVKLNYKPACNTRVEINQLWFHTSKRFFCKCWKAPAGVKWNSFLNKLLLSHNHGKWRARKQNFPHIALVLWNVGFIDFSCGHKTTLIWVICWFQMNSYRCSNWICSQSRKRRSDWLTFLACKPKIKQYLSSLDCFYAREDEKEIFLSSYRLIWSLFFHKS